MPRIRPFPARAMPDAIAFVKVLFDCNGGNPMNPVDIANELAVSPTGHKFRDHVYSSSKYGLTTGSHTAREISATPLAGEILRPTSMDDSYEGKIKAFRNIAAFADLVNVYADKTLPRADYASNYIMKKHGVEKREAEQGWEVFRANVAYLGWVRKTVTGSEILVGAPRGRSGGQAHDDANAADADQALEAESEAPDGENSGDEPDVALTTGQAPPAAVFIAHNEGRSHIALKVESFLSQIGIKAAIEEFKPNMGKSLIGKIEEAFRQTGYAIVILTKDLELADGRFVPSPSVVYELGISVARFEKRVVVLYEDGLDTGALIGNLAHYPFSGDEVEPTFWQIFNDLKGFGLIRIGL